jgi:hypothetical protein
LQIFGCGKYSSKRIQRESPSTLDNFNLDCRSHTELDHFCDEEIMAEPQTQPADDSQLPESSTNSNPTTPQRTTMPTFTASPTHIPRHSMRFGNGQCTHLTMTRLYTAEYRCSICLRIGSMGWVYICTQDRELLLEEDMERASATTCHFTNLMTERKQEKLDKLCGIFERPTSPRPRGPAARLSSMSFFDENSDEALESYSIEQLQTILKQRAHVSSLQ